jgi:hypothetical protein
MLEELAELLPEGWELVDDAELVCPHGHPIELDGHCPEGCESPLREAGII